MKKTLIALLLIPFAGVLGISATASAEPETEPQFVKVIIEFANTPGQPEQGLVQAFGGKVRHSFTIVDAIAATVPSHSLMGLLHHPLITSVHEDQEVFAVGITYDQEYAQSWGVERIESGVAHEMNTKGADIKIGIIDSGIDYDHPDLDDNYKGGYDFYYYDHDPMDVYGHGTHVAGTACGEDNDNGRIERGSPMGVVGVAPECDLYSLRVLGDNGSGIESDIVAAIEWSLGRQVYLPAWGDTPATTTQGIRMDVVNLSLGSESPYSPASEAAFAAAEAEGLVIVAAAGNSGNSAGTGENVIWPANFGSVIAVAATDDTDARASFSSTGANVEIAAPGVSVYSTWNDGTSAYRPRPNCIDRTDSECYKFGSGTSMASPHVAGVVALLLASGVAPADIRATLRNTAEDLGASGWDSQFGFGLVNVRAALGVETPNVAPEAAFSYVTDLLSVQFTNASSDADGTIVSYGWDFGDGNTSTLENPAHAYAQAGTYNVTLTVTDNEAVSDSMSASVAVSDEQGGDLILTASGYKLRAIQHVALEWGGNATNVDIYRDGGMIAENLGGTSYDDNLDTKRGGPYTYKVCETGTQTCSNEVTVSF